MIIKSIKLTNFRNHASYSLDCHPDTTLILGKNGYGKTSVLEAIYILTRGKSFRATDPDIMKRGEKYYRIEMDYDNGEKILATYDGTTKTFIAQEKKSRRLPKKQKYPVVLFLPSDLNLISSSPGRRRDYFNRVFAEFNDSYSSYVSRYEKALKQRNELLKADQLSPSSLFSWNILLAKYGSEISKLRNRFTNEINTDFTNTYRSIAENDDEIQIIYKSEINNLDEGSYLKKLEENFTKDSYLGHTSFGIHRDDFIFNFNHNIADGSASRGESRSTLLALKFIESNLIYQKTNQKPIILLDDVFSELDPPRRHALVKNFKSHQVIITSVEDINDI